MNEFVAVERIVLLRRGTFIHLHDVHGDPPVDDDMPEIVKRHPFF